jgi:hypothetical protein
MECYDNPWIYNGVSVTDDTVDGYAAFVYIITNLDTNKKYIGKKRLQFVKTRSVKKKKKRTKVPSDWKQYYGSNKELQDDVESLGIHRFKREILHLCKTLGESTYFEAAEQFNREVLLKPDQYYNSWIMCKVSRSHLPKGIFNGVCK